MTSLFQWIMAKKIILILPDLSAAFDMVDHEILINWLEHWVGLKGNVLKWFKSNLIDRFFSVSFRGCNSKRFHLPWGVLQGSILAPILFSIYMLLLGAIFQKYKVSFHCYADDTQIYLPVRDLNSNSLDALSACLHNVKDWMAAVFLSLTKTNVDLLCSALESMMCFSAQMQLL
uniref:Reverse transcriptase domain-containing protein n=1 Tax=Cyprinus carpio carpio TaxID=630221 RepID=A0A9J7Z3G9_CYPCA